MSINHLFLDRCASTPWEVAYEVRAGAGWRALTWAEVHREVAELSAGLLSLGLDGGPGAILSETRVEWVLADFAVLCAGLATTTLYPSSTSAECAYVLNDAAVSVLFVEDETQLAKVHEDPDVSSVSHYVLMEGSAAGALTWAELRARGAAWLKTHGDAAWEAHARSTTPDDLATLIYTSGTTGRPKGVCLVHDCWLAQSTALAPVIDVYRRDDDKLYIWLPLAHAYGKVIQLAGVAYGVPTAIDGDVNRLAQSLGEVRPTYIPAVPRVFEKMSVRIAAQVAERGERPAQVFEWSRQVAIEYSRARSAGQIPWGLRLKHAVAERVVYRKIRERIGGKVRAFLSGSAPLSPDLHHFYEGIGIPILEGYGLTECAAVATANTPDETRIGSVGKPGDGLEIRIRDGEVQLRGRAVMRGYHNRPEATAAAFDGDWFRTGDLGALDADGFLHITGRLKELIITAGGKNIAPAPIEHAIKAECALLQEVVLIGDRRPCCMAVITLDEDAVAMAAKGRVGTVKDSDVQDDPDIIGQIRRAVDAVNLSLAPFERVKDFVVLDHSFSIEDGQLTPSQKVRRSVVAERYAASIDALYDRKAPSP